MEYKVIHLTYIVTLFNTFEENNWMKIIYIFVDFHRKNNFSFTQFIIFMHN